MSSRRVVVTGLGLVSPLGNTVPETWDALCRGKSGIGPLTAIDDTGLATRIAGEVKNFDVTDFVSAKEARRYDIFMHYGLAAAKEALDEAGLLADDHGVNPERVGLAGRSVKGIRMLAVEGMRS